MNERAVALSRKFGRPVEGFDIFVGDARESGSKERDSTYVRKDGTIIDVSLAVTAVHDPEGALTAMELAESEQRKQARNPPHGRGRIGLNR